MENEAAVTKSNGDEKEGNGRPGQFRPLQKPLIMGFPRVSRSTGSAEACRRKGSASLLFEAKDQQDHRTKVACAQTGAPEGSDGDKAYSHHLRSSCGDLWFHKSSFSFETWVLRRNGNKRSLRLTITRMQLGQQFHRFRLIQAGSSGLFELEWWS